ncbi:hypothetical protein BP5796_04682 [Coleophoma crateriformis]|uniref:Uncharacterized protein n=1 Tax=Coleophoma crateriformis TaxID=565419 RepID=A0A3D8SAL9_9HELO|nr:hypothetical protein BP5796_04682 [Coleophoma crateriformis]
MNPDTRLKNVLSLAADIVQSLRTAKNLAIPLRIVRTSSCGSYDHKRANCTVVPDRAFLLSSNVISEKNTESKTAAECLDDEAESENYDDEDEQEFPGTARAKKLSLQQMSKILSDSETWQTAPQDTEQEAIQIEFATAESIELFKMDKGHEFRYDTELLGLPLPDGDDVSYFADFSIEVEDDPTSVAVLFTMPAVTYSPTMRGEAQIVKFNGDMHHGWKWLNKDEEFAVSWWGFYNKEEFMDFKLHGFTHFTTTSTLVEQVMTRAEYKELHGHSEDFQLEESPKSAAAPSA